MKEKIRLKKINKMTLSQLRKEQYFFSLFLFQLQIVLVKLF
jgi:hypothetical protein